jgi:hypothetical protein
MVNSGKIRRSSQKSDKFTGWYSIDYPPATHDRSRIEVFSWLLLTLKWQSECKGTIATSNHLTYLFSSTKGSHKANSECQLWQRNGIQAYFGEAVTD